MSSLFQITTMELIFWYAITIAALVVVLFIYTVGTSIAQFLHRHVQTFILKYLWYTLLVRRKYWGSITLGQGLLLSLYFALNGFCMGFGIHNASDLISRTGTLASINIIPLFFGGRMSLIADFLGFSVHSYYLAHHWIGRVVVIQGLIHTGLVISRGDPWKFDAVQTSGISVSSCSPGNIDTNENSRRLQLWPYYSYSHSTSFAEQLTSCSSSCTFFLQ